MVKTNFKNIKYIYKKSHALKQIEEGNINGNIVKKKTPVNYKMKLWKKYARSDLIKWGWGLGCG